MNLKQAHLTFLSIEICTYQLLRFLEPRRILPIFYTLSKYSKENTVEINLKLLINPVFA